MSKTSSTVYMTIKLFQNGKLIKRTSSSNRDRISFFLRTLPWQNGHLKVTYDSQNYNDAEFSNLTDTKWYLSTFTEKKLIDWIKERATK